MESFICPCNNIDYNSLEGLLIHQETDVHMIWKLKTEIECTHVKITHCNNKICSLEEKLIIREQIINECKARGKLLKSRFCNLAVV
jgi:hypothetical protein